nr:50S ribosomal protein L20-like [Cherax quadricarinatus]
MVISSPTLFARARGGDKYWKRRRILSLSALWDTRLTAGCLELGTNYTNMKSVMDDVGIAIDRKTLQNMAIWEPRSFRIQMDFSRFAL